MASDNLKSASEGFFDDSTKQALLAEDSEAWRAVTTILLTIVSVGATAVALTVLATL